MIRTLVVLGSAFVALGLAGLAAPAAAFALPSTPAWICLVFGALALAAAGIADAVANSSAEVEDAPLAGERARRGRISLVVVLALGAHALLPLRYYLGTDPNDERFAWRMFSTGSLADCEIAALEVRDGVAEPLDLGATVHSAWPTAMRFYGDTVVRPFLRWRCAQPGIERSELVRRCRSLRGARLPDVVRSIDCGTGRIRASARSR